MVFKESALKLQDSRCITQIAKWVVFALATQQRQGKAPKVQLSFIKTAEFYPYLSDIVLTSPLGVPQCHCSCFGL